MEIARVTVIDDKLSIMLDSFIKPQCDVIDYNTRYVAPLILILLIIVWQFVGGYL